MIRSSPASVMWFVAAVGLAGCAAQGEAMPVPPERGAAGTESSSDTPPMADAQVLPAFTYDGRLTQGGWIVGTAPEGAVTARLGEQELALDEDRRFFAAFDRDAGEHAFLRATLEDGREVEFRLDIAPRAWRIERVNVAKRPPVSSEEWWKKREPEWLAIKAAREKETGARGWRQNFIWPVKGRISGRFGAQRIYKGEPGSYHSGLDIAPGAGTPFVAPADGVVVLAATGFSLEGNLLIIDHGQGLNSAFLHAQSLTVKEGDTVKRGQMIGRVGSSGRSSGPHLHWGIKWNDARLDPLLFLPDAD
ncbi:M23 family metallopeptidase [Altererythrobacter sp. GH1-8]|uniref:M23 family metallopeptidase n=1 Tax=Altererythrobacter sp. GH1-8 TaxID=3349333 RepID=UPI00374C8AD6